MLCPGVRQHAEPLVDQALVIELLEGPDHGLHVTHVHGLVSAVKINPTSLTSDIFLPLARIPQHRLGAVLVEVSQTHLLDLALVLNTELLLCLQLGRQTMAVPAKDTANLVATHSLVTRNDVLDVTGQQVTVVR